MAPRLIATKGASSGTILDLEGHTVFIGRDMANTLRVADPLVSRRHCTIDASGESYEVADLDSRNGTFVNGVPVGRRALQHGDTIRLGHCEFVFLTREPTGEDPADIRLLEDTSVSALQSLPLDERASILPAGVAVGRMARDLAALFRISNIISSIRELTILERELLQLIFEVIPAESGAIVLLGDADEEYDSVFTWNRSGRDNQPVGINRDLLHRALWERSIMIGSAAGGTDCGRNVLCSPLVGVEKSLGAIYLVSPEAAPPFCEDHIQFLTWASRVAAVSLENRLILRALASENRELKEQIHASKIIGESRAIGRVEEFIARVAPSNSTVLIRGESGTGKELVARAIHNRSSRAEKPFIAINCAAIPEALLESELFGHEKGAFTGAVATRKGKLEAAEDGTLFLDEIGEMAPLLQAKLLRVLQERQFERVGGSRSLDFAARVLAATNRNLEQAIKAGEFRQDLYYRLNVVSVTVPPLREHREDIPLLALYFAAKYAARSKRPFRGISREARTLLMSYSWPGNVRELENAIEHAIVLGLTEEIVPEDLPVAILEEQSGRLDSSRYHAILNQTRRSLIVQALDQTDGNYPEAARLLGIHPKYLHRLSRNLRLKPLPAPPPGATEPS